MYKSQKSSFAVYFIQHFWIRLQHDFILELLLWGYCWGSMQITIFNSLSVVTIGPTHILQP